MKNVFERAFDNNTVELLSKINTVEGVIWHQQKEDLLKSRYEIIKPKDFYTFIYGDLKRKFKLLLKDIGKLVLAEGYDEVCRYYNEYRDVFNYMVNFKDDYKPTYKFASKLYAFVVDIDDVTPDDMHYIISKIDSIKLKPNLLVNTGNGVHLYYILDDMFDIYGYSKFMVECHYSQGNASKRMTYIDRIDDIYTNIKNIWAKTDEVTYQVDELSIVQSLRMCGSKTKNDTINTTGYVINNQKYDIYDLADEFNVALVNDDERRYYEFALEQVQQNEINPPVKKAKVPRKKISRAARNTIIMPKVDVEFEYDMPSEVELNKPSSRCIEFSKILKEKFIKLLADEPAKTVRKENLSRFSHDKNKLKETQTGNRQSALHILMSRARMYGISEENAKIAVRELFEHFNAMSPHDKKTEGELEGAFKGYVKKYSDAKILEKTGIDVSMENKRNTEREKARQKKLENSNRTIIEAKELIQLHGAVSIDKLAVLLKAKGIKTSPTSLKRNEVIRILLNSKGSAAPNISRQVLQNTKVPDSSSTLVSLKLYKGMNLASLPIIKRGKESIGHSSYRSTNQYVLKEAVFINKGDTVVTRERRLCGTVNSFVTTGEVDVTLEDGSVIHLSSINDAWLLCRYNDKHKLEINRK